MVQRRTAVARACVGVVGVLAALAAGRNQTTLDVANPGVLRAHAAAPIARQARARRVVWILVDGLRLDASRRMPALNRLRAGGRDVIGHSHFPTYTVPNVVAQASGLEPRASGIRTDWYAGPVRLDSVFQRAKLAGLRTAVVNAAGTGGATERLYADWIDETSAVGPGGALPPADLVLVYIEGPDIAGHQEGAASGTYASAVRSADQLIDMVVHGLDPAHDALVVTADHGHLDGGGHGGAEPDVVAIPIVLWGAGVPHWSRVTHAGSRDVAPTIAALLGLGPLRHATGRSLVRVGDAARRQRLVAARAAVGEAAGPAPVAAAFAAVLTALLATVLGARSTSGRVRTAWVYVTAYVALLVATRTLSFSVSNDTPLFSMRLLLLASIAATLQLLVGRRGSLVPAAFVTGVVVTITMLLLTIDALPFGAALRCFLPIPAFAALSFASILAAVLGAADAADRPRDAAAPAVSSAVQAPLSTSGR
jgi:hypothetical protein